jgi:hypothetical protein
MAKKPPNKINLRIETIELHVTEERALRYQNTGIPIQYTGILCDETG